MASLLPPAVSLIADMPTNGLLAASRCVTLIADMPTNSLLTSPSPYSRGVHTYRAAFTGRNLVDWLLEVGLCADRGEGLLYGRHLLAGGVLEHVNRQHHFFDLLYLYHFTDSSPEPAALRSHAARSAQRV